MNVSNIASLYVAHWPTSPVVRNALSWLSHRSSAISEAASWKSQPYFWLDQAPSNSRLEMHHGWSLKDFQLDIKSHLCRMQTYCVCLLFRCIACKMSDHDSWKSIWSKQGEDRSESPESHWNATPLNSCN